MAKEQTFLLVSLEEEQSKKLAQVIANETSRKLLHFLTAKSATESEISKQLAIPMPTVHYNLQQLVKAGLVESKEYHYSEKGKEVNHYSLSKKYIIIAPSTSGLKTKLRSILPVVLVIAVGTAVIGFAARFFTAGTFGVAKSAVPESVQVATLAAETGPVAGTTTGIVLSSGIPVALWFAIGGICAIAAYLIISMIRRK
jgi:DNA-binding transcriptional ArsR family regulator